MDIFAHAIWTSLVAKTANQKFSGGKLFDGKKLKITQAAFWGIFPDLLAFGLPFAVIIFSNFKVFATSGFKIFHLGAVLSEGSSWIRPFVGNLYPFGHSIFTFLVFFSLAWLVFRRPIWEMSGWLLHILIDIFTHAGNAYPTPFLWPVSSWRFLHGIQWSTPWFMIINYSVLLILFILVFIKNRKGRDEA